MGMRQLKITKSITKRESQSLEKYLQEIGKVELSSSEEEVSLARKMRLGDSIAMERLIKANLRFVVSVAKQYQNQGLTLSDLINEGNLGLIKAAQRFDETKGFKFISYAVWWIRQSILQALAEQGRIVRLPLNKVGLTNRINKTFQQLEQILEREPSIEELSDALKVSKEEVVSILMMNARHLSVDTPVGESEDQTMADIMQDVNAKAADDEFVNKESLKIDINRSLTNLTERQKNVICYFFGIGIDHPLSLEDIGGRFSLTRERVRQIKDKAILKLQSAKCSKYLKVYLG